MGRTSPSITSRRGTSFAISAVAIVVGILSSQLLQDRGDVRRCHRHRDVIGEPCDRLQAAAAPHVPTGLRTPIVAQNSACSAIVK